MVSNEHKIFRTKCYEQIFHAIFPKAAGNANLFKRAVLDNGLHCQNLFQANGTFLPIYKGHLRNDGKFVITNPERMSEIKNADEFRPLYFLGSHSKRAWFNVSSDGTVSEFKGLTPVKGQFNNTLCYYDLKKINNNSNQPYWLSDISCAGIEHETLKIIGSIETNVVSLGDYFKDLEGYAQLMRKGKPGNKYIPWHRMSSNMGIFELLSELEEVPLEKFLYNAGYKTGSQLKIMHSSGLTMHGPAYIKDEASLFYSSFHSGNVTPYGDIVDTEGATFFDDSKEMFYIMLSDNKCRKLIDLPADFNEIVERFSFNFVSRISDLNTLITGRGPLSKESPLLDNFYFINNSLDKYKSLLSGILNGYYFDNNSEKKSGVIKRILDSTVQKDDAGERDGKRIGLEYVWKMFSFIESELM